MALIDNYIPGVWDKAGDTGAQMTEMKPEFRNGLLHLINYMMHTQNGRIFMHSLIPGKDGHTIESVREPLLKKYAEFNVTGASAEALIGAHIAGFAWVDVRNDPDKRAVQENIFNQHVAAISWALWEESQGPMFSLGW